MKKLYAVLSVLLALAFVLSACGQAEPTEAPVVEEPVMTEAPVVTEAPPPPPPAFVACQVSDTGAVPTVTTDDQGWPTSATWPGMNQPLFTTGLGDFVSVKVNAFAPRWALQDIWSARDAANDPVAANRCHSAFQRRDRDVYPHVSVIARTNGDVEPPPTPRRNLST